MSTRRAKHGHMDICELQIRPRGQTQIYQPASGRAKQNRGCGKHPLGKRGSHVARSSESYFEHLLHEGAPRLTKSSSGSVTAKCLVIADLPAGKSMGSGRIPNLLWQAITLDELRTDPAFKGLPPVEELQLTGPDDYRYVLAPLSVCLCITRLRVFTCSVSVPHVRGTSNDFAVFSVYPTKVVHLGAGGLPFQIGVPNRSESLCGA